MKKYELTNKKKTWFGRTLYKIRALKDFGNIKKGDLGGWIEKEDNLSQFNNAWIYHNAKVYGNAKVHGNAKVCNNAKVCDDAEVYDGAEVYGNAIICNNAIVYGNAKVYGKTKLTKGYIFVYLNKNTLFDTIPQKFGSLLITEFEELKED